MLLKALIAISPVFHSAKTARSGGVMIPNYLIWLALIVAVFFGSGCIADAIMLFLKHLGYPQPKKMTCYLTWVIFTVIFQIGFLYYLFQLVLKHTS